MPSTYTENSGIEKPGSGEQSGTWGATTNNNFEIIDRALNGVGTITLVGTSHTLTTTDGTLSEGQYKVLVLEGTPSGTNTITITPDDQDKIYLVQNNSGQAAIFTQGSGGNATVANGASKIIYANGIGAASAVTDFSSSFPIVGPVDANPFLINGTTVTSTATEINKLDGFTGSVADLNYAKDLNATGVTAAEFDFLDGVTSNIQLQLNTALTPDFPAGTAMLFQQSSAPTGWTKSTTHNDKAIRVVSGTAGSGGSNALSSLDATASGSVSSSISGSTAGHTLTTSQIPSHNHSGSVNLRTNYEAGTSGLSPIGNGNARFDGTASSPSFTTNSTGGNGSHSHGAGSLSVSSAFTGSSNQLNIAYVDVIIATKN
jgi:hypothetical protein